MDLWHRRPPIRLKHDAKPCESYRTQILRSASIRSSEDRVDMRSTTLHYLDHHSSKAGHFHDTMTSSRTICNILGRMRHDLSYYGDSTLPACLLGNCQNPLRSLLHLLQEMWPLHIWNLLLAISIQRNALPRYRKNQDLNDRRKL